MKKKKLRHLILIGIAGFAVLGVISSTVANLQPDFESILGIKPIFNVGNVFHFFEGLTLVKSPVIKGTISSAIFAYTEDGKKIILSAANDEGFSPTAYFKQLDVLTGIGNKVKKIEIVTKLTCENISTTYPPILIGGFLEIDWKGTKKDGSTTSILSERKQLSTAPTNCAGTKLTLATWSVTKDEIENRLQVGLLGDNFKSLQNVQVFGILNFQQGTAKVPVWSYGGIDNIMSYSITISKASPFVIITDQHVDFKIISPSDSKLNIQTLRVAKFVGILKNYNTDQGYPTVNVYYSPDGSTPTLSTPINTKQIAPSRINGDMTEFDYGFPFSTNAKLGKYTFEFVAQKRDTKPRLDLLVFKQAVSPSPEQCNPPASLVDSICQIIDETPGPETSCDEGYTLTQGYCIPGIGSLGSITDLIALIQQNLSTIIVVLVVLIILAVIIGKATKPKPRPPYGY